MSNVESKLEKAMGWLYRNQEARTMMLRLLGDADPEGLSEDELYEILQHVLEQLKSQE